MMKKVFLVFALSLIVTFGVNAQEIYKSNYNETFKKNDVLLDLGIGLGTALNFGNTIVPPLSFRAEYCVADNLFDAHSSIGVGAYVGYALGRQDYFWQGNNFTSQRTNSFLIGFRGAFHYQFVNNLDTYAGIMLGGNIANTRIIGSTNTITYGNLGRGGFLFDFFVGARYYVKPNFALFGEVGFGVAFFNIGVSFKL